MIALPRGRHFAVTWGVADEFAGMTSALMHRSRAFVRLAGVTVDILTFDERADYPALSERLRERGELIDGMRLVNIWDWMRDYRLPADAPGSLDLARHPFTPLGDEPGCRTASRDGVTLCRTRLATDGTTVLQRDFYRDDGSLLLSDRRDVAERGVPGGRSIVLCDETGTPQRSWGRIWAFYRYYLDRMRGGDRSYFIVDSKTAARFMAGYRRRKAATVHVVHNSHLAGDSRPLGPLRESRRAVFENLDAFDAVVLLSERQRNDVEMLLGPHDNLAVVPNGRDVDTLAPAEVRPIGRGVALSSLTGRKRVDHAIRGAQLAAREVPGLTLDVYGRGELATELATIAADAPGIRLCGHDPAARAALADSSFLLLTSRSEGFPLALVEAMAAGCIPIAYDVPYGPADIIVDGRNGFLVDSGDIAGLARAILRLQELPDAQVRRMRRRARRAAAEYTDAVVTRRWARLLARVDERKARRLVEPADATAAR